MHGRFNLAGLVPGFTYTRTSTGMRASAADDAEPDEIAVEESEKVDLLTDAELDSPSPSEIDGIPRDHVGDLNAPADELEDHPGISPFDVDEELSDL